MWIGSLHVEVPSHASRLHDLVLAYVLRDGIVLTAVDLTVKDLGGKRAFEAAMLGQVDAALYGGVEAGDTDVPGYGLEFAHGLHGHFGLRLVIYGDDSWVHEAIRVYVRELRRVEGRWVEDTKWFHVATWSSECAVSHSKRDSATMWTFAV